MNPAIPFQDHLTGLLLGTAVGDALGLPMEGLSPERIRRRWPGELRHRFLFGRGMISDDTEHALFVAQALLAYRDDVRAFQRCLAWKLQWWFLALPAGVGLATARACVRLWLGFPASRSGVFSAGNGPAMRSAIIGAVFASDAGRRREFVAASTRLTHTDPRAVIAALAVAEAAAWICRSSRGNEAQIDGWLKLEPPHVGYQEGQRPFADLMATLAELSDSAEWRGIVERLGGALNQRMEVMEFAAALGLSKGVTGYAYHTVPVALFAWLRRFGDFRQATASAIACGGDADTVGAIVGALAGCTTGPRGIPVGWLKGVRDWPRSQTLLQTVANRLVTEESGEAVPYFWPGVLPRNLVFLLVVLVHGFRRLLPSY